MNRTKGLKIAHMCNVAFGKSGMFESVYELMHQELAVGYNAKIIDVVANNPIRKKINKNHPDLLNGNIIGTEEDNFSQDADILCWHRFMPEEYFEDKRKNLIMFLHGMPDFVFMQEHEKQDKAFSLIAKSYSQIPNCYYYIGMWKVHEGYWNHLLPGKLVNTNCWADLTRIQPKADYNFNKEHIKLVCFDTWRGHKEPYWVINAVKILINKYERGEIPFKVTLDIYGQDVSSIPEVWILLVKEYLNKYIFFRGYGQPQDIFNNYDIALTQIVEETRIVRESLLSGIPLIVGEESVEYTDYGAGFRNVEAYSREIERCCLDIMDDDKRKAIHKKNREYAIQNYDVVKNAEPIFDCFEKVYEESKNRELTPEVLKSYKVEKEIENFDFNKIKNEFKTKVLICSINSDKKDIKGLENIDYYYIPYSQIANVKNDYVESYLIKEEYPEKYFDFIYIDYLDIMPQLDREKLEKYINKIKTVNGELIISKGVTKK